MKKEKIPLMDIFLIPSLLREISVNGGRWQWKIVL